MIYPRDSHLDDAYVQEQARHFIESNRDLFASILLAANPQGRIALRTKIEAMIRVAITHGRHLMAAEIRDQKVKPTPLFPRFNRPRA